MPVRRLPEALANQIAAGEVVERPGSVVKELVENAVDADAQRIEVRIEDGGRSLVEVVDDGSGMSREDALLSLERHTTSKIETAEDLFDIRTFGFRGEALSSIASVSRFTLVTRRAEDLAATKIVVDGGRIAAVEEAGAPVGTRIEVRDLFFNVPARLKFLKQRATELGHVTDWLTRIALVHPNVGFSLTEEGRAHIRAEATDALKERIAALLGRELYDVLYAVEGRNDDVQVRGFGAGPQRANGHSREIYTFVNGRFVRDRGLLHAVGRTYETVLPVGRHPAVVLFIDLPPNRVDVNVHPQKLEVRFENGRSVYDAVAKSLAVTLSPSPWLAQAAPVRKYTLKPAPTVADPGPAPMAPETPSLPRPADFTPVQRRISEALQRFGDRQQLLDDVPLRAADSVQPMFVRPESAAPPPAPTPLPVAATRQLVFSELRYLGQIHRTYLVCESPDGLVLLDQHAAHERVLYEKYKATRAGESSRGQPFLVPVTMDLAPSEARLVEAAVEDLADLGFELEPFGGTTFLLKAAPPELSGSDVARTVTELAAEVRTIGHSERAAALEEALLARMACHSAVRARDQLSPEEATSLLRSLDGTPFHAQCPHGRPVVVRFDAEQLKEMFGRTYEGTPKSSVRERWER